MSMTNKAGSLIGVIKANKPLRLLLIAIALAVLAAFLAMKYLELREQQLRNAYLRSDEQTIKVIVPKQNLPAGSIISGNTVAAREVPAMYVHQTAIRPAGFNQIKGRRVITAVKKGTPLLWDHVAGSKRNDFSDVLAEGRRAITVQVDQINSFNGMIEPGNEIDLYVTMPAKYVGGKDDDAIFPIIQKVTVLATGRRLDPKTQATMNVAYGIRREPSFNTVTIDVLPKEAALVFAAQSAGSLSALLRNREDIGIAKFGHMTPDQLFSIAQKVAREKALKAQQERARANPAKPVPVVRDENGKIIGIVDDNGNLVDPETGEVIAQKNPDGSYTTADGKNLGKPTILDTAQPGVLAGEPVDDYSAQVQTWLVDYLSGGNSKNGVAIVQKVPVQ